MWDSFAMRMAELCLAVRENAYFRATGNKMVETMVAEHVADGSEVGKGERESIVARQD